MDDKELFIGELELPHPLSKDETRRQIDLAASGSKEARDKLIMHNIRLVLFEVLNKFAKTGYEKKDLVSIGNIGLLKAINTYDLSKGFEFTTYAIKCIDNEILTFLRKAKNDKNNDSLDQVIFKDENGNEVTLVDRLSDDSNIAEDYEKNETYFIVREMIKELPYRDKEIILMYFGFYNKKIYTQSEIAEKLNISRSYISDLIKKNIKILKKQLVDKRVITLNIKSI